MDREIYITFCFILKLVGNLSNTDVVTLILDLLYLNAYHTWCSLGLVAPWKYLSNDTTCAQIQHLKAAQLMLGKFRPRELSMTLQVQKCSRERCVL